MGKRTPSAPPAPDPAATARVQGEYNLDAARQTANLNRTNTVTPWGSTTWSRSGPDRSQWIENDRQQAIREGKQLFGSEAEAQQAGSNFYWTPEGAGRFFDKQGFGDQWTATVQLSPEEERNLQQTNEAQRLYGDAALSQLRLVQDRMSQPFNPTLPDMVSNVRDRSGDLATSVDTTRFGGADISRDAVERALLERMRPSQERDRASLETRLANQGIGLGSEAWRSAMDDYSRSLNDARLGAVLSAGQEQSRVYGLGLQDATFRNQAVGQATNMDLARAGFTNQARSQSLAEQTQLRNQPLNEAAALLTGQMIQAPQQIQAAPVQVAAPDYQQGVGLQYAAQQNAYNQQMQRQNATMGALAGLGGAALGAATGGMGFGVGGLGSLFGGIGGAASNFRPNAASPFAFGSGGYVGQGPFR